MNHAQLFNNKKTLCWAVVLSVIVNWIFLEMNAVNLAGNYSAVYDGWANESFSQQSPRRSTMRRALTTVF